MTRSQKAEVQARFGATAEAYVRSAGHAGGLDLERLVAWGRSTGASRLLDIATGGGHAALAFSAFTPTVVATDLTEPMLQAARAFAATQGMTTIRFLGADVEALPFRDAAFGAATCRIAAHHFPDVPAALRQVARVLQPGGTFLLQDILGHEDPELAAFILEVEKRRDPSHVRSLSQAEWAEYLSAAGLAPLDEAVVAKVRPWEEWTGRMRMTAEARAALDRFVLEAPARCREAFSFTVEEGRIRAFSDRMLLVRAAKT
ncbi:MAG: methyltransferase domain-containing protein [Candidatus Rokubacteria bacterium]|nr:methyltransferase domain-containing protein [Candidatus Rokubacteria bacterium]